MVFNGEIYNYLELRSELEVRGHRFRSTGDTEVLLKAYIEWGTSCLDRLNGMWAFMIFDRRRGVVFGSRDRFGIKPLYWHRADNALVFASEIKGILASGHCEAKPDLTTVSRFLMTGELDHSTRSYFSGIEQLEAGSAFECDLDGRMRIWRYWSLDSTNQAPSAQPAQEFAQLFDEAVRLHMRSDVPVAVHLSGGLDSTAIICASARVRTTAKANDPLLAFSYVAPEFDESRFIADTIAQTGARRITLETTPLSLWEDLGRVLHFQDEPVHSMTAIVGYQLMRVTAQNGIRVVLNGQGADETLGGYGSYFRHYWYSLVQRLQFRSALREIGAFANVHAPGKDAAIAARHVMFSLRAFAGNFAAYRMLARIRRRLSYGRDAWLSRDLRDRFSAVEHKYRDADLHSTLLDSITRSPLPLYLRVEDRNSMAHSVEARVPFLDHRLVQLALAEGPEWKLRGPWNKYILREAMRQRIPDSVRERADKMGFPTPMSSWFKQALYEPVMDVLGSRQARERGLYDTAALRTALEQHRNGGPDVSKRLFDVVETELWFQQKIDKPQAVAQAVPYPQARPVIAAAAS
jgi:asparagine synthase (glutamine-hydrolysing)